MLLFPGGKGKKPAKDVGRDEKSDIFKLVKMIVDRRYHPVRHASISVVPPFHI